MHLTDSVVKTASCAQLVGSAALPEGTVTYPSSAQETAPSAPPMSAWGTASHVLVDRLYACKGAAPPMPNSARLSGDLGPSPPHHFASLLPTPGGMPLGAVDAALMAAMCPVPLEMPCVGNSSVKGVGPSLCWAQPRICTGRCWKPMGPG